MTITAATTSQARPRTTPVERRRAARRAGTSSVAARSAISLWRLVVDEPAPTGHAARAPARRRMEVCRNPQGFRPRSGPLEASQA